MQVVEKLELDNETVVEVDHKVTSQLIFTETEATIPIGSIQNLIFRKPKNSNVTAICTGFMFNNEWYFDRPDNGMYRDPFDGANPEKWVGERPVPMTTITVNETTQGIEFILTNVPYSSLDFYNVSWNNQHTGEYFTLGGEESDEVDAQGNPLYNYAYKSGNTVISFADKFTVSFVLGGGTIPPVEADKYERYEITLEAKESRADGTRLFSIALPLGTDLDQFGIVGSTVSDFEEGEW